MMAAIGAGFATAGFFHLLTHGLFKALLFLGAGAVIHAVHSNDLSRMGGLASRMPQTTLLFVVGTLSLAGIPLFGGFQSKEEILGAVWAGGLRGPFVLLLGVAFLTAFYMFRVVFLAFFGAPAGGGLHHGASVGAMLASPLDAHATGSVPHPHDPPPSMRLPLWVLAGLSMAVGVALLFEHPEPEFTSPGWLMPAGVGAAAGGILLAWLTYQRRAIDAARLGALFGPVRRAALARFWIDDIFERAYDVGLLGFSRIVGWVDRYLVDGWLNALSAWTLTAGDDLRAMQSGRVQDYVYGVAVGLLVLVLWIQWVLV
jgi:NADH-quinone oxidoreductase subunit L